jgi:hypothetical protein
MDQNLPGTLNITARLRKSTKVILEIGKLQIVEKLKILSLLRVFDFLDLLHIGVKNGLLIVTIL